MLNKGTLADLKEKLRICLPHTCKAGLKINAKICSLILKDITYLGYVITREGIK